MKWAYYNDVDPNACEWAKELIRKGLVLDGEVDCRSISEVQPNEIKGFIQCHFFCGILGWPLALDMGGWPRNRKIWTGSPPCQPFSIAGAKLGEKDKRHLWPDFFRLIRECRPPEVIGEQVSNAIKKHWLDGIFKDMETENYACGAVVLGAHSAGAPHVRQRIYWVATDTRRKERVSNISLADLQQSGLQGRLPRGQDSERQDQYGYAGCCSPSGPWGEYLVANCKDGKSRRIGVIPANVANGLSIGMERMREDGMAALPVLSEKEEGRAMLIKGYGNAIVPPLAAEFVKAFLAV